MWTDLRQSDRNTNVYTVSLHHHHQFVITATIAITYLQCLWLLSCCPDWPHLALKLTQLTADFIRLMRDGKIRHQFVLWPSCCPCLSPVQFLAQLAELFI